MQCCSLCLATGEVEVHFCSQNVCSVLAVPHTVLAVPRNSGAEPPGSTSSGSIFEELRNFNCAVAGRTPYFVRTWQSFTVMLQIEYSGNNFWRAVGSVVLTGEAV